MATKTLVDTDSIQTLTNKSLPGLAISAPVFSGAATGSLDLLNLSLTNVTLAGPTISSPTLSGTAIGTYTLGGTPTITAPTLSGTVTGTYTLGGTPTYNGGNVTGGINFGKTTIASALTPDIFAVTVGQTIDYTGVATCTGFVSAPQAGAQRLLICAGACTFTAGANMVFDGVASGANYSAVAGDKILVTAATTSQFYLTPFRADGTALGTLPRMSISGYVISNSSGDAVNDIDITIGECRDASNSGNIVSAAITKQSDATWTVGTNAGGLDTGAVGNNDYYVWAIKRTDTNVTDALISLSSTAPTMPTSYTLKRLIGWFKRVAGTIVAFTSYETSGGGIELMWTTPTLDIDLAATLTTSRRTDAVKVPLNFSVVAQLNVGHLDAAVDGHFLIYNPDQSDLVPSASAAPLFTFWDTGASSTGGILYVRTSAAGLIAARSTIATVDNYRVSTQGFSWARRN